MHGPIAIMNFNVMVVIGYRCHAILLGFLFRKNRQNLKKQSRNVRTEKGEIRITVQHVDF